MRPPADDPYFITDEEEAALEAKAEHEAIEAWLEAWERDMDDPRYIETLEASDPLLEIKDKTGREPCGECYLQPGETCDICNASEPTDGAVAWQVRNVGGHLTNDPAFEWWFVRDPDEIAHYRRHPDRYELRGPIHG